MVWLPGGATVPGRPCLREGHFSHIFIDEAAQAREPETIAAFSRAGHMTKIAIAGDHKQVCACVAAAVVLVWDG